MDVRVRLLKSSNRNAVALTMDASTFEYLTGNLPFPWQVQLLATWREQGIPASPSQISLPTGVGKTSVLAIWLMLLLENPSAVPRRLVYVVNRRTVVDQTTDEALKLQKRVKKQAELAQKLEAMSSLQLLPGESPLAVSTLRGQLADNRIWSADPTRPAIIIGTVDMIGSRLLFGGYRIGFKSRPTHAALLAQDTLLVHDEAHLEPAFQQLVEGIVQQQRAEAKRALPCPALKVVALSATNRAADSGGSQAPFTLTPADAEHPVIAKRIAAPKQLKLYPVDDTKELISKIAELALQHRHSGEPILIFARELDTVEKVKDALEKDKSLKGRIATLTGTMRGQERDNLAEKNKIFKRFLPIPNDGEAGTVFLICTSAGEVGVNLSATHLVCDLSTFESMAQRFGRVNRFGESTDTRVDVVVEPLVKKTSKKAETEDEGKKNAKVASSDRYLEARIRTRTLLEGLLEVSPRALGEAFARLSAEEQIAAFSPAPDILALTDILLDGWALTSIRGPLPGRPPLEPYLHGVDEEYNPPQTAVAWREEVGIITGHLVTEYPPKELLEAYPLKPHEILSDRTDRVFKQLEKLVARLQKAVEAENDSEKKKKLEARLVAWLVDDDGLIEIMNLGEWFGYKDRAKQELGGKTLLLHPRVGGLDTDTGMLDGNAEAKDMALDVSAIEGVRFRPWSLAEDKTFRRVATIDTRNPDEEVSEAGKIWYWYESKSVGDGENMADSGETVYLPDHNRAVGQIAATLAHRLGLPEDLATAVCLAAQWHDLGKARTQWQRSIGNPLPSDYRAKSEKGWKPQRLGDYRHEFGSLLDVENEAEFKALSAEMQDLVRHLIAAHHGRARPHFTTAEAADPERGLGIAKVASAAVPHRFARLQARYGRWGLAYLESIVRTADHAASAGLTPRQS